MGDGVVERSNRILGRLRLVGELLGLEIAERISTDTPFGTPSGDRLRGRLSVLRA